MKGKILISSPSLLSDMIFYKSIILIVDETDEGHTGFILNRPGGLFLIKNKNNSIESWIAIFGNEERDISTRIRLFNQNDCSFERIELFEIKPNRVTFINLNQLLNNPIEKSDQLNSEIIFDQFGVCQIESEESNLSCNLYILKKRKWSFKIFSCRSFYRRLIFINLNF